jgi:hypothetical protein
MTEGPYSNHLARFMRERRLTDPGLARLLKPEISKQQIFNLRKGHRKLTVEWAKRLAPHLEVPWQELITGSPGEPADEGRAFLLSAFDLMDPNDRETLLRVAQSMARAIAPDSPLEGQLVERPGKLTTDEVAMLDFWRGLDDAEKAEAQRRLEPLRVERARV